MWGVQAVCGLLASLAFAMSAAAQSADFLLPRSPQKLALVVGNADYKSFADLPGSKTDAEEVGGLLRDKLGFEVVQVHDVETFDSFTEIHLKAFAARIRRGDLVVFYFSGHGFGRGGENYLVPTKAPPSIRPEQLSDVFLPESAIREYLKARSPGVVMVLLDACRTYAGIVSDSAPPYVPGALPADATVPTVGAAGQSAEGLTAPTVVDADEIVSFAAAPGMPALGLAGGVSPYSKALLEHFAHEGWELSAVRREVIYFVRSGTEPPQIPYFTDSLVSQVFLRPNAATLLDELESWKAVLATGKREDVKKYYEFNRVGTYAHAAELWLASHPVDVNPKFSQVSPLQAELAWVPPSATPSPMTVLDRLPEGVGVSRRLVLHSREALPQSSDEATSETLLQLHGQARLTRSLSAATAKGSTILPRGIPLDITSFIAGTLRADALPRLGEDTVPITLEVKSPLEGLRIGAPFAEVTLTAPADRSASVVDPGPLRAQVDRLKAANRQVGWMAISTPKASSSREQGLLGLQAIQVRYLLTRWGVPEAKISTVEGLDASEGVRVRIYAF